MARTKIICTLGPASDKPGVLLKMMKAGMDVVRLNFSHGTLAEHRKRIVCVEKLNKKYRSHLRILGDLEGYRIRVGFLKEGKPLHAKKSGHIWLTQENIAGSGDILPIDYSGPMSVIKRGQKIFIDDGNIALEVEISEKKRLRAKVLAGGEIKERKGIIIPGLKFGVTGLNKRDRENIDFCLGNGVDFIAQSFVRSKADILAIRKYIRNKDIRLIAKIESIEGIRNIDGIIRVSDGIMVARGDMGVSLPVYEVPVMQKKIIRKCNKAKKFVITATQMLESMTENRIPTRAEVSDVANAILDGTDYVMLSAETAAGQYPAECVDMMNNIIKYTEKNILPV